MPHSHALLQYHSNVTLGGLKAGDRVHFGLGNVFDRSVDGNVNPRRLCAGIQRHLGYVTEIDARVREFALDHGSNFQAQRLRYPVLMMLSCSVLRHDALLVRG